jgi:hypothetical protein
MRPSTSRTRSISWRCLLTGGSAPPAGNAHHSGLEYGYSRPDVPLVEDIVDSGYTIKAVLDFLDAPPEQPEGMYY